MTIQNLRIFTAVCRCGSVTKAAEQLHMAQPAVSRAIHELEHEFSLCLFERLHRRLVPTTYGAKLYEQSLQMIASFDSLEQSFQNGNDCGLLRVGASITIGNFLLPSLAMQFQKTYPSAELKVTISNSETLQNALSENMLDLALIEDTIQRSHLVSSAFATDHLILITPPMHPLLMHSEIMLQDIAAYPLLMREKGSAGRNFVESVFAAHHLILDPIWESRSTNALIRAVAVGIGISILPERLVENALQEGKICTRPIKGESLQRTYYEVHHKDKYLTTSAKAFLELLPGEGL